MRAGEMTGRTVLDVSTATELAKVESVIVDGGARRLAGFRVTGPSPVLPFAQITSLGADAVTVSGPEVLHLPDTDVERHAVEAHIDPIGLRVLDDAGTDIGTVDDLEINADTGEVHAVIVGGAEVPGSRLLGVGAYALVVRAG